MAHEEFSPVLSCAPELQGLMPCCYHCGWRDYWTEHGHSSTTRRFANYTSSHIYPQYVGSCSTFPYHHQPMGVLNMAHLTSTKRLLIVAASCTTDIAEGFRSYTFFARWGHIWCSPCVVLLKLQQKNGWHACAMNIDKSMSLMKWTEIEWFIFDCEIVFCHPVCYGTVLRISPGGWRGLLLQFRRHRSDVVPLLAVAAWE